MPLGDIPNSYILVHISSLSNPYNTFLYLSTWYQSILILDLLFSFFWIPSRSFKFNAMSVPPLPFLHSFVHNFFFITSILLWDGRSPSPFPRVHWLRHMGLSYCYIKYFKTVDQLVSLFPIVNSFENQSRMLHLNSIKLNKYMSLSFLSDVSFYYSRAKFYFIQ